jgi:hypothetical protein
MTGKWSVHKDQFLVESLTDVSVFIMLPDVSVGDTVVFSSVVMVVVVESDVVALSLSLLHATKVPAIAKTANNFFICCKLLKLDI